MLALVVSLQSLMAVDVTVTMNNTSQTMTLKNKATGVAVDAGAPTSRKYTFSCDEGTYVMTGYAADGTTVSGTMELEVTAEQTEFAVFTCIAYATNSDWVAGTDYSLDLSVAGKMGEVRVVTTGMNNQGRYTFMVLNGDTYNARFVPSAERQEEGYLTLDKSGTVSWNVNVYGVIPMGVAYSVTVPADATFFMGQKISHFTAFREVVPESLETSGGSKTYNYILGSGLQYNFRTWRAGGLTQAGYFTMSEDLTKVPVFNLSESDYATADPKIINHSNESNGGYETGDIFLNINERNFKQMNVGETYDVLGMRSWELVDNITSNYFIEPDFHYTVVDENGQETSSVVTFDKTTTNVDPWVTMTAVGEGTAIVLVDYDAISLNTYSNGVASPYLGGPLYGATWPENTGVFIVNVGNAATGIEPNMLINENNSASEKNAHPYVDAECDVFYYLDTEEGATYTFTPSGVESVSIAYPVIGEKKTTYNGFTTEGVTENADGSYTLLLKQGRNIVKLSNAAGQSVYQVLNAKPCHREITNANGSGHFQQGDKLTVQYSGLQHAANKLAGIHNFNCSVYYGTTPGGTALTSSANQYTFGSTPASQAITVSIPSEWNVEEQPSYELSGGVLKVAGFGDPIGNHRIISRTTGRNANFTAISHTTYFGYLPTVSIPVETVRDINLTVNSNVSAMRLTIKDVKGTEIEPNAGGTYTVSYGNYTYEAGAAGYRALRGTFTIADDAADAVEENITLQEASAGAWDGVTQAEPAQEDGVYQIGNGAEMAWFAGKVNDGDYEIKGTLTGDIDLADYAWTPVGGTTAAKAFKGTFNGQDHLVKGLYINNTANTSYMALFSYLNGATVERMRVEGEVTSATNYTAGLVGYANNSTVSRCVSDVRVQGKQYTGGVTGYAAGTTTVDRSGNVGNISGTSTFTAGVVGNAASATTVVTNCYNIGDVAGTGNVASVANANNASTTVKNCWNVGFVTATSTTTGNVSSSTAARNNITDNYVLQHYNNGTEYETEVTEAQFESGEVAYLLGEPWGQEVGVDEVPVIDGMKVYCNGDTYFNDVEGVYSTAVLTFEDADYKGGTNFTGHSDWSSLIDSPENGGKLLYGESGYGVYDESEAYRWYDENNTYLSSSINNAWGSWAYWNGGVAVSNYKAAIADGASTTQLSTVSGKGNNGSDHFAVANGYMSDFGDSRAVMSFGDGVARVIDHMYVNTTSYFLQSITIGNDYSEKAVETTFVDLVVEGFDLEGESTGTVRVRLADGLKYMSDWTYVRLSTLGKVATLKFDFDCSDDQTNDYGMTVPGYVAIDDIAVLISSEDPNGIDTINSVEQKPETAENYEIYDLNGRRLTAPIRRAINIINGKKVFVP
mgnify:CR=1 FL=1